MSRTPSRSRLAAEMYLAAGGDGRRTGVTLDVCARKYGVSLSTVHHVVLKLREERRAEARGATPEDECTL